MTLDDHLLANTLTALVAQVVFDPARDRMWRDLMKDALPRVSRDIPAIGALAEAAVAIVKAHGISERQSAMIRAEVALVRYAEWRIGLVQERQRQEGAT